MKKLIIDHNQFNGLSADICRSIQNSEWKPDYIVGIARGGLLPAITLSYWFSVACKTLSVSLRDYPDQESNLWLAEDAANGKNILIVDDINDSGATLDWIISDWQSSVPATEWSNIWGNNVRFAVVVDNLSSEFSRAVDYCGLEIDKSKEDVWVEFPWENWWRK